MIFSLGYFVISLHIYFMGFTLDKHSQDCFWQRTVTFKSAQEKRCGIYPCSSTWKFLAFLGVRDLYLYFLCGVQLVSCVQKFYFYFMSILPVLGGGVCFLTFILLVQRVLSSGQFFTEWRTVFSVIEFRNSLHPTLHPPCELHGKEQFTGGGRALGCIPNYIISV